MTSATTDRFRSTIASPLPGVSAEQWDRLCRALQVQQCRDVSASGGLGSYDLRPRRLVEIGLASNLRYVRARNGRQVYTCNFVPPLTWERFRDNPVTQYLALSQSMKGYHAALTSGEIVRPEGTTLAGALAILHRGGAGALRSWPDLFPDTRRLYERARGAF